ncbi:C-terminal binding protein [Tissierella carlieri]|uniref:C-terminal binding protein n=1 Tax=Tissierella carlieri TaxID=689904 RepID=A0ABT1SH23_9FIRM|nr:C-terminal binding protein [Tissierella carlieri]MCQ4925790.1 C-terminal binding protein [Tissierella carlieri]
MNIKKKVALCGVPGMNKEDIEKMERYIREEYENVEFLFLSEDVLKKEELIKRCRDVEILISWDQEMDDEIYEKLNLRAYCAASTGFNAANIEAATRNKVIVTNVVDYCVDEVATHAIMLMLGCNKKLYSMIPYVKDGNWDLSILGKIKRFENSTVGLFGFGSIPKAVSRKLSGFGVNIISYDPFVSEEDMKSLNVTKVDLDTLFKESDYLSLHTPLLDSTKNIINKEVFEKMKPTAFLINTARGGLVNHEDLYEALTNNYIQGAGLDVLENEPPKEIDKMIIALPNTIITAHSAYLSEEASDSQIRITAEIVGKILNLSIPNNVRNPQILNNIDWINK